MPDRHVGVQARCFLCDHNFHRVPGTRQQLKLVALFAVHGSTRVIWDESSNILDLIEERKSSIRLKGRKNWYRWHRYHPDFEDCSRYGTSWSDSRFEQDVKYCGQCVPERALFLAHEDCWRIAERHGVDAWRLYAFAMQTHPLLPWRGDKPHSRLWGFFDHVRSLNSETALGKLLIEMSRRLPPELQESIMADLQQSAADKVRNILMDAAEYETMLKAREVLFTRLAVVESQVVPALKSIRSRHTVASLLPSRSRVSLRGQLLMNDAPAMFLWIRVTNIFGRPYISEVGLDERSDGALSIPVSQQQITGLRFALGKFGIRAIRILYDGGSKSPWLGDPSGCWFGNIAGTKIRDLDTTGNGLRVVRLDLNSGPMRNGKRNALMDVEIDTLPGELLPYTCNSNNARRPLKTTPHYYRWDMLSHLPLKFGSTYSSGLTVYWDECKIKGMASYGPENQSAFIGQRTPDAMHFSLAPQEFFTSFWLRPSDNQHRLIGQPFVLTLTTSLGRSCHFGPHYMVRTQMHAFASSVGWEGIGAWDCGAKITAILVDPFHHLDKYGYHNFGVIEEPLRHIPDASEARIPTLEPIERIPTNDELYSLHRLTMGSLHNVTGLEVRRHGKRCLGLRILHGNERDDCLGSWDPLDTPSITTLYSPHQGPLTALLFHLADGRRGPCVSDILPCLATGGVEQEVSEDSLGAQQRQLSASPARQSSNTIRFNCGEPGKMLAWWCDEDYDELRSYEPPTPVRVPNTDLRLQLSIRWQPPAPGSDYRRWDEE